MVGKPSSGDIIATFFVAITALLFDMCHGFWSSLDASSVKK